MLKLFLSLRYLRKKKIMALSVIAVALSVGLLVVVSSLFGGFIEVLQTSGTQMTGDIVVDPGSEIVKYDEFIKRLEENEHIKAACATLSTNGLLHLPNANVKAVQVVGINPTKRANVTNLKETLLVTGANDAIGWPTGTDKTVAGYVGIAVTNPPDEQTDEYDFENAKKIIGKKVVLTTGVVTRAKNGNQKILKRKVIPFVIEDLFHTGVYDFDSRQIYLPIEVLQKKMFPNFTYPVASQIQIKLNEKYKPENVVGIVRQIWKKFATEQLQWSKRSVEQTEIVTTKFMQAIMVAELRKQMAMLMVIFGAVSLSVILLVLCIFYMIVSSKRKDIAIIKSAGASGKTVAGIFVLFGAMVGLLGAAMGVAIGAAFVKNVNAIETIVQKVFNMNVWKSSVYMFDKIPSTVNWMWVAIIVVFAIAAAIVGALLPACMAWRLKPVDVLRYE